MSWTLAAHLLEASAPALSATVDVAANGVDFLGTRAANLEMLGTLTGAFNNLVVSARQHAIIAWGAWRFRENCRAAKVDPSAKQFITFMEALETIQLVGQIARARDTGRSVEGLGSGAAEDLGLGPTIPLTFKAYDRTRQTSALAAVQYGPSSKGAGLRLVHDVMGIWVPTEQGLELARAIDDELSSSPFYAVLTAVAPPTQLSLEAAEDLAARGLGLRAPEDTRPELLVYRRSLLRLGEEPSELAQDRRPLSIALLLELIDQRRRSGELAFGDSLRVLMLEPVEPVPAFLEGTRQRWQLFQLRQLQRFAFESALGLVEARMAEVGQLDPSTLGEWLEEMVGQDIALQASAGALALVSADRGAAWQTVDELRQAFKQADLRAATVLTLRLLGLVLNHTARLAPEDPALRRFADTGGAARLGLLSFAQWWGARAGFPLRDVFVEFLLEDVLQQHVGVAMSRLEDGRRRLRFSSDEGLWSLVRVTPSAPSMTPDRIGALLELLWDVRLLSWNGDDGYALSEEGRVLLQDLKSRWSAVGV